MIYIFFNIFHRFLIKKIISNNIGIIIRFRVVIDFRRFLWIFDRFKKFVLSTFAKNVPLIIKTSRGGYFLLGGALFYFGGRNYTYPCSLHQAILPFISSRIHISTHLHLLKPSY